MSTRSRLMLCALLPLLASPSTAATLVVDDLGDPGSDDGACTLREAITAANSDAAYHGCPAGAGADRIEFSGGGTITLTSALPDVTTVLAIVAPSVGSLWIDGDELYRPFAVDGAGASLTLEKLAITGGLATHGGALNVNSGAAGGSAVVRTCLLTGNTATSGGGAIHVANEFTGAGNLTVEGSWIHDNESQGASGGGGIRLGIGGTATVVRSTIASNRSTAENGHGGGIYGQEPASLEVVQSTISGNETAGEGGGIGLVGGSGAPTVTITSSTITGNTAGTDGGANDDGGGLFATGTLTVTLRNTIVAGNTDSGGANDYPDLNGSAIVSAGANLVGDNSSVDAAFPAGLPNGNGDFVGSSGSSIDPMLGALGDNGGLTPTHLPSADPASPAVDAGSCLGELQDQRGHFVRATFLRIFDSPIHADVDDGCDIGAVELGAPAPPVNFLFASSFLADFAGWSNVVGGP